MEFKSYCRFTKHFYLPAKLNILSLSCDYITVLLPAKVFSYLEKFGIGIFNMSAFEYFTNLSDQILSSREEQSPRSQWDFVQLCKSQLIPDPTPNDNDAEIDKYGLVWSKKGEFFLHFIGFCVCTTYKLISF